MGLSPRTDVVVVDNKDILGIIVINEAGTVTYCTGIGCELRLQEQVADKEWRSEACLRRLMPMNIDDDEYLCLVWELPEITVFLISEIEKTSSFMEFVTCVDFSLEILDKMFDSPFDGMIVVNREGKLLYMSKVHEDSLGLTRGEALGRQITDILPNSKIHRVLETGKSEVGQLQDLMGTIRIVSRFPVKNENDTIGAYGRIMFRGPEAVQKMSHELSKLKDQIELYKKEITSLRGDEVHLDSIVGSSDCMQQLKEDIKKVAKLDVPVLLLGESGTGKEMVAQAIHQLSRRHHHKMVTVNAAALPSTLVESELFGYEAGAFTGAQKKGRKGKFELADKSTLFLDEIGDMPMDVQVKLLRVLQDGVFEHVGGDRELYSDFRLVSATNRDLGQLIEENDFRLDLYYRVSSVIIHLPPLKERLEDIPELVEHYISKSSTRLGRTIYQINPSVYSYLQEQPWPGNVRQLLNELERACIFCEGNELTVDAFRPELGLQQNGLPKATRVGAEGRSNGVLSAKGIDVDSAKTLKERLELVESELIQDAMKRYDGNKKRVSEELGISRSYLYKKLDQSPGE